MCHPERISSRHFASRAAEEPVLSEAEGTCQTARITKAVRTVQPPSCLAFAHPPQICHPERSSSRHFASYAAEEPVLSEAEGTCQTARITKPFGSFSHRVALPSLK